ncbi:MAG: hypothetical protein KKA31_04535, partial [Candidatus Margulisbacteria bacterium]|nr:hypothetical protein [Candidatus Margulisiibacteriota bacterium]
SDQIKHDSISHAKEEAKQWLQAELDRLTLLAAQYKIKLLKSLQTMEYEQKREATLKWLHKIIVRD